MKRLFLWAFWICPVLCVAQTNRTLPKWLDTAVFYQIYPATFQDSDGDGIGDLRGIIDRLDYVQSVGVNAIWFSPMFCSEFQDGGYDITDFYRIDPRYGTNAEWRCCNGLF